MAITCTAPAVKAALVAALATALPTIQVTYSHPGDEAENSAIWVGDVRGTFAIPTMKAGRKHRDESYAVQVVIGTVMPGSTPEEAEAEAFRLLAVLEDLLADDPGFPVGVNAAVAGEFTAEPGRIEGSGFCNLLVTVDVSNRLY